MTIKTNELQLGDNVTTTKNVVLSVDPVTGDFVLYKGVFDGVKSEVYRFPNSGLGNYANDGAAATGGVPVGAFYRNGSVLMIRVA